MSGLRQASIDRSASLNAVSGGQRIMLGNFKHDESLLLWEPVGGHEEQLDAADASAEERDTFRRLAADPVAREGWELRFDLLVYDGTLDVPSSLHVPQSEAPGC